MSKSHARSLSFYADVYSDIRNFLHIGVILEKLENEGFLVTLSSTFEKIMKNEMIFAFCSSLKRIEEDEREDFRVRDLHADDKQHDHLQGEPQSDL